jgi:septum formation protein
LIGPLRITPKIIGRNIVRINSFSTTMSINDGISSNKYKDIILGSGSATRKSILRDAGITFTVVKADIDESSLGDRSSGDHAHDLVLLLAHAKADAIIKNCINSIGNKILLTADQVVVCNNKILEKPMTEDIAREFIAMYSQYPCTTIGSIVLTDVSSGRRVFGVDNATIYFNPIPGDIVDRLISEGTVLGCAGGLMIEHELVQKYIMKVDGSIDSVMGLSMSLFHSLMNEFKS